MSGRLHAGQTYPRKAALHVMPHPRAERASRSRFLALAHPPTAGGCAAADLLSAGRSHAASNGADLGNEGSGDDRTDAWNLFQPPARLARPAPGHDTPVDRSDLGSDGAVLTRQHIEYPAGRWGNPVCVPKRMARPVGKQFQRFGSWQSASTYPAYGRSPGQDGGSRVPVLINLTACDRHFRYQVARTPVRLSGHLASTTHRPRQPLRRSARRPISIRSPSRRQHCRSRPGGALPIRSWPACWPAQQRQCSCVLAPSDPGAIAQLASGSPIV
jgi:hypothetical protein